MEAILIKVPIFDYDGKTVINYEYYWKIGSFSSEWFKSKRLAMEYIQGLV